MGFNRKSGAIRVAPDRQSAELAWGLDIRKGAGGVFKCRFIDTFLRAKNYLQIDTCRSIDTFFVKKTICKSTFDVLWTRERTWAA